MAYGCHIAVIFALTSVLVTNDVVTAIPLQSGQLDAALVDSSGEYLFLFSGGNVIQVSLKYKAEGRLVDVNSTWPGLDPNINAAVNWTEDSQFYFFKGNAFYSFTPAGVSNIQTIPDIWPDIFQKGGVDAAANKNGKSIFFKGCTYWDPNQNFTFGIKTYDLPSLTIPCDIDAAWEDGDDVILVKDELYWKWGQRVSGPFLLDNLLSVCTRNPNVNTSALALSLPTPLVCNGDARLCPLPIDQVTLPGSHNAGSGFAGPFGFPPCMYQNHDLSVLEQLRFGIRYLDVDSCWNECGGNLGTCHRSTCAGLLCSMLIQIKTFLIENPTEVVMVNFNHDMKQHDVIVPELVRQIEEQLSPFLNSHFRETGQWPTLEQAVTTGKRLFVIIATQVTKMNFYTEKLWIIDEVHMASTYTWLLIFNTCSAAVSNSRNKCTQLADKTLIEVSVFGAFGSCIDDMMAVCDDHLFDSLQACSEARHNSSKAPNVLMVDYPAFSPPHMNVLASVRQQNVRNLLAFRGDKCRVRIDAATSLDAEGNAVFFSGSRMVKYNKNYKAQASKGAIASISQDLPTDIDAAISGRYWGNYSGTYFFKGCDYWVLHGGTVTGPSALNVTFKGLECDIDAAVGIDSTAYFFKGCHYWTYKRFWRIDGPRLIQSKFTDLPCDIDSAVNQDDTVYFFQNATAGGHYWAYSGRSLAPAEDVLDWKIDTVVCED